ncbi:MAG: hypothetical protein HY303_03380 [Candidatus Wallbacteria bacterium]|nr:hypothetical protein [Candidatus Wallbacteria bacterium]
MLARPAVVAAARLSPTRHARELAASALALHDREVARPGIFGQVLGAGATAWVAARSVRLSLLGKPLRQPVSRRFSYPQ